MKEKFIITIISDDKRGLLNQFISIFNKRGFEIEGLNFSRTDQDDIVIITFELLLPVEEVATTLHKIEKIIEVYKVFATKEKECPLRKCSFFKVNKTFLSDTGRKLLIKHAAEITQVNNDSVVIEKLGTDNEINNLYRDLEEEYLVSYCKTTLVSERGQLYIHDI
ncbi:MAG TPA: hypothetical protein VFT78_00420 [Hanamia sp.]|nr:hypothetical protein [Hanamia sp.]